LFNACIFYINNPFELDLKLAWLDVGLFLKKCLPECIEIGLSKKRQAKPQNQVKRIKPSLIRKPSQCETQGKPN
jgi:hypothetical protein